ncbi:MAG TPA: TetR family transcriptional regulator C-terminal domain-containing protein [Pseudonocardia sp.]|nr:TetR family transcriptional regulator C-terminal domain-containing protein [Pseudonocardia sp.]
MTSRAGAGYRRKPAEQRKAEIVAAAGELAMANGLEALTLRRVAESLGVFPGLVSHYFPASEDLVAAAFGHVAGAELAQVGALIDGAPTPLAGMRALIDAVLSQEQDGVGLLWLDAWNAARRRAALHDEVTRQMSAWQARVVALIESGRAAGVFGVPDPEATATVILAAIDGLSMQAALRPGLDHPVVRRWVVATVERELGLLPGALHPPGA